MYTLALDASSWKISRAFAAFQLLELCGDRVSFHGVTPFYLIYRMAPNFQGAQFSWISQMSFQLAKIVLHKIWGVFRSFRLCVFIWSNRSGTMFLLRYFSTVSADQKLPAPQGELTRDVPSSAIFAANTEVKCMQIEQQPTTKLKNHSWGFRTLGSTEFPVLPDADLRNNAYIRRHFSLDCFTPLKKMKYTDDILFRT